MPSKTSARTNKHSGLFLSIALALGAVLVHLTRIYHFNRIAYQMGLTHTGLDLHTIMLKFIVFWFAVFCLLTVLIIRAFVQWHRLDRKGSFASIGLFVFSLLIIVGSSNLSKPRYIYFTEGVKKWAQEKANIPLIEEWSRTINCDSKDFDPLDESQWPDFIKELSPGYVLLRNMNDGVEVALVWGGGFGHWGLVVGPESTQIQDLWVPVYKVPLSANAYVFREN